MDIEQHSSFKYRHLEDGEFRVLDILHSHDAAAEIHCRLVHHPFQWREPYNAISYTWGTDPPNKSIRLNGSEFLVRENLYHALRSFRRADEDRRIWIDALCIDQSNTDERNSQVARMREIFANAREVAVWLGEDPSGARQFGMEKIPWLSRLFSTPGWPDGEEGLKSSLSSDYFLKTLDCVSWVFEDRWWRRIWVIQEVAVAKKDPTLYCGSNHISWGTLYAFVHAVIDSDVPVLLFDKSISSRAKSSLSRFFDGIASFHSIARVRKLHSLGDQQPLGNLLITGSRYHCTDPRDKVFALLGIMNGSPPFQADYNQSQRWVNIHAMTELILATKDLRSLSWITGEVEEQTNPTQLPSWVSDFCGRIKTVNPYNPISTDNKGIWADGHRAYAAGLNHDNVAPRFEEEGLVLVVRGLQVESIDRLGSCCPEFQYFGTDSDRMPLTPTLESWKRVAGVPLDEADYHNSEQNSNFWRTVLLDRKASTISRLSGLECERLEAEEPIIPRTVENEEKLVAKLEHQHGPIFERRFTVTSRGFMGLCPGQTCVGDQVCVLVGGEVPYIVRPIRDGYYKLIGECYIQGIMDGEAIEDEKRGRYSFTDFRIR